MSVFRRGDELRDTPDGKQCLHLKVIMQSDDVRVPARYLLENGYLIADLHACVDYVSTE